MKIQMKMYLYSMQEIWETEQSFVLDSYKGMEEINTKYVFIDERIIEVEIPEGFDRRPGAISALQEQKKKLHLECHAKVSQIDEQISKLQALEFTQVEL